MRSAKIPGRYTRRESIAIALCAIIIFVIFIPFPDINAVRVELQNKDIQAGGNTAVDLKITAQNPATIPFPGDIHSETLPSGEIRITLDHGTAPKVVVFNFTGAVVDDSDNLVSDGIITGLTFGGITHGATPGGSLSETGPYYGYGAGFFGSSTLTTGTIGTGATLAGISSDGHPSEDTTGAYTIHFNPSLLDPILTTVMSHTIRVDVLATSTDTSYFSSGDVSFTNTPSSSSLTIQTKSSSLLSGATYTISPIPATSSGTLTVSDGGLGDSDGSNNGIISIANVPTGIYKITQTVTPSGFTSLLKSDIATVTSTLLNPTIVFQVTSLATDLSQLEPTFITSPSLSSTTLDTWIASFSAVIANSATTTAVTNVNQLPQIIIAGKSNAIAISSAVNSQSSVLLNTSFPPLTSGSTIISTFGVPNYTLTDSTSVVSVIPTIVTTVNPSSGQVIATPPIDRIIPGQQMIILVTDSLIPSFGGLKEIDLQSSPTATSTGGTAPAEWLVAEIDKKIPSSLTSSGIRGTLFLFVNMQYPFEQTGIGFNWGNPSTFAEPPTLTLVVNKTSLGSIKKDSSGCPVVTAYTLRSGIWTTNGLGEVASTSISPTKCQVNIQTQHFSKFAFSLEHIGTVRGVVGGGKSHVSGVGLSGNGTVSTGITSGESVGGGIIQEAAAQVIAMLGVVSQNNIAPNMEIHEVSYDVCKNKMATIFVDTDAQQAPSVMLRTSFSNQTWATLSSSQFDPPGSHTNMNRFVFNAQMETNYRSFDVIALAKTGNGIYSTGQTVNIISCRGDMTFGTKTSFISETNSASTFAMIKIIPIKDTTRIKLVNDENGRTIAYPSVLYSSFKHNDQMMYRVTAPDGTCVIGLSENCLVTQSTQLLPGHIKTVTIGGQEYKIRYSGTSSPLERFSISSEKPILGQWKAELDSQNGEASSISAMNGAFLRIKYVPV